VVIAAAPPITARMAISRSVVVTNAVAALATEHRAAASEFTNTVLMRQSN
jgi:hypothetical protein